MGEYLAAVAAAGVVGAVTDWLCMGVLFHDRYGRAPEIWRTGTSETARIVGSTAIGAAMSAAFAAALLLLGLREWSSALLLALLFWAGGALPAVAINGLWVKFDPAVSAAHAAGYLARLLLTAAAVVLIRF